MKYGLDIYQLLEECRNGTPASTSKYSDYSKWEKHPRLESAMYTPKVGDLGPHKFRNVLYAKFPENREAPKNKKGFLNYEAVDAKDLQFKQHWRDLHVQFIKVLHNYRDNDVIQVLVLDAGRMRMTRALLEEIDQDYIFIDVTNPFAQEMLRRSYCPYESLVDNGACVTLYAAFLHEYFQSLSDAMAAGILSDKDMPKYVAIIYDACGYFQMQDMHCIRMMFSLRCFKDQGPSLFSCSFSCRQEGNGYFSNAQKIDCRIREVASDSGYEIYQPRRACKPICNSAVYTLVFYVFNKGEAIPGLRDRLDASIQDNPISVPESAIDYY